MRADVCLHRNAAAIDAAEEEGVGDDPSQVARAAARGGPTIPNPLGALLTPAHTELSSERVHFDPVRVFLGPAPSWKGPVLGPTGAVTTSADAEGGSATRHRFKGRVRLIRHPAGATAQKLIAARAVKPKTDAGAGDK
jgi:hypothetical protein